MDTDNLALRPNCLLTKYPLVFLTGRRSLFFYEKLGGELQNYIAAHGYVVYSPVLAFRSEALRKAGLQKWLKQQSIKQFHFILSPITRSEFSSIFENYPNSTFTHSTDVFVSTQREPFSYKLHKLFCTAAGFKADPYFETLPDKSTEFYDRFLDRCIELAENDCI